MAQTPASLLAEIEREELELRSREAEIARDEASLRERKEQLDLDKRVHAALKAKIAKLLSHEDGPLPEAAAPELPPDIVLRVGVKRRAVLKALRKLSHDSNFTTSKAVQKETGFNSTLIYNVVYEDVRRGFIERRGEYLRLTDVGREFLRRVEVEGVVAGNTSESKTPAVMQ